MKNICDYALSYQNETIEKITVKPVRDNEARAVLEHLCDGVLNELLGLGVDGARCLVEHEYPGIGQYNPREGYQLFLPGGQPAASLAHLGIIALFELLYELVGMHEPCRCAHLLIGGVGPPITDVLAYSS